MLFNREFFAIFAAFAVVEAKIYNPCEVAGEILDAKVPKIGGRIGELERMQCSPRDIGRLVCVASLHNFDTNYNYSSGNETYVGIFGLPRNRAANATSIVVNQRQLVEYQMFLRRRKLTAASEVICNYYQWFVENYFAVLKFWNLTETPSKRGDIWQKRGVLCEDYKLWVFVVDEKFSKNVYKPGVFDDFTVKKSKGNETFAPATSNSTVDDEFYEKPCHGDFYCGEFAKCPSREPPRVDKSRMERKVDRFVRVVDWTIIILWFVVVVGGVSWGFWYIRNPRRRGRHDDDWSRPILTAQYVS